MVTSIASASQEFSGHATPQKIWSLQIQQNIRMAFYKSVIA